MVSDERLAADAYDAIVKVVDDDDMNRKVVLLFWIRPRDLSLPWEREADRPEIVRFSENQVANGTFKFYEYDEDVVMDGGMRRGSLLGKTSYGTYKDGSEIYKDKSGYYIVHWNKRAMRPYKKHIKGFKPDRSSKTRKAGKRCGKKTRRNH